MKSKGEARLYAKLPPYRLGVLHHCRSTRVFKDQVPLSLVLEEKDLLLTFWAFGIDHALDEPSSLLAVKPNMSVDGLRKTYTNLLAAGYLRKGIDNLLRERLKEDRPRACATGDDGIHRLCPCPTVFFLALRPIMHK